ncbi:hypothetical protein ACTFIW_005132 [Dictyostelium discoideum]
MIGTYLNANETIDAQLEVIRDIEGTIKDKRRYPFIFEFIPKLNFDVTPSYAIIHAMNSYENEKFHLVSDSAFFSKASLQLLNFNGWNVTVSDSSASKVGVLLKGMLKEDKSWVAVRYRGYISIAKMDLRDGLEPTYKVLATTAYVEDISATRKRKDLFSVSESKKILKLGPNILKKLCSRFSFDARGTSSTLVKTLCGTHPVVNETKNYAKVILDLDKTDGLKDLSLVALQDLVKKINLMIPTDVSDKESYINLLINYSRRVNNQLDGYYRDIVDTVRETTPLATDLYKKWFNVVDVHDKYLYLGQIHGHYQFWRCYMVNCLIKSYLVNVYAFYMSTTKEHMIFVDFKKKIVEILITEGRFLLDS